MKSAFLGHVPGCASIFPVEVSPPLGSANDAVVELDMTRRHSIGATDLVLPALLERLMRFDFGKSAYQGSAKLAFTHGVSR